MQDSQGEWKYLKGAAEVRTSEMTISADEIDFNSDSAWAYARGHVRFHQFASGDIVNADHAEYNLKTEEGKFYIVTGTSPAKMMTGPGVLGTSNPFYFQGEWADRFKSRMILHRGYITDCKVPKSWWTFHASLFDIVPGERAVARSTVFRVRHVPIFYLPYFRRPLGKNARQSGFLTPTFGHSTTRGFIYGAGYYWAINPSFDMDYILQYFSLRGPAHTVDFRGKPNSTSDFSFGLYGVQDKGISAGQQGYVPGGNNEQGGYEFHVSGRTQLLGFTGRLDFNYLSSFIFAAAFTNNFSPQENSIGFLQRHFNNDIYSLNFVINRKQVFENFSDNNQQVLLQKLPNVEASSRLQQILHGKLPIWFSFDASGGILSRREPLSQVTNSAIVQTGLMPRSDFRPTVSSAFSFAGFSLYPSVTFEATDYGSRYTTDTSTAVVIAKENLFRKDADFVLDFRLPSLERTYSPVKWLHLGDNLKHVIEADAQYEYVTGVNQFQRVIHFDETDIISNTNQLTVGLTNRFYTKDKKGNVREVVTWRLRYARYFDPTFGNTVLAGQRNVNLAQDELTPFTFLDGPRSYSPVVSSLYFNPYSFLGIEYRADYDPFHEKFLDHALNVSGRYSKYYFGVGETAISASPILFPAGTNQVFFSGGLGNSNRRGINAGAQVNYDIDNHRLTFSLYQFTYNTDCCGFSVQLRRINNIVRNDNEYLFSFVVANIGAFGSLPRQNRIF